jgi:hypothetical protein
LSGIDITAFFEDVVSSDCIAGIDLTEWDADAAAADSDDASSLNLLLP